MKAKRIWTSRHELWTVLSISDLITSWSKKRGPHKNSTTLLRLCAANLSPRVADSSEDQVITTQKTRLRHIPMKSRGNSTEVNLDPFVLSGQERSNAFGQFVSKSVNEEVPENKSTEVLGPYDLLSFLRNISKMNTQSEDEGTAGARRRTAVRGRESTSHNPDHETEACRAQDFPISIPHLERFVIFPKQFNLTLCTGTCPLVSLPSNDVTLQQWLTSYLYSAPRRSQDRPLPDIISSLKCCKPSSFREVPVVVQDGQQNVYIRRERLAKSCGCQ